MTAPNADTPQMRGTAAERLLSAARNLFYRRGIRAIGVEEIVRAAGVTKPTLYRSFPSKDELAASYLRNYEGDFWKLFDRSIADHPGDPRAQILDFLAGVGRRAGRSGHRGCGMTNAAVEYPDRDNPAHVVCEANKRELRSRLRAKAAEMGAIDADQLADGLLLLFEGANICGQIFGEDGPAINVAANAASLISASLMNGR
ncbi:TetR/AcrR family transcriptional regulator [soil metagenome]